LPVYVEGLQDLSRAFKKTDRDARLGFRKLLRQVAEPVRRDAEAFARSRITRIGPSWFRMRTGVTQRLVYVAPRMKGTHGRGPLRRPNMGDLLMYRAMEPALQMHEADTERAVEHLLDVLCDEFNYGGPGV